MIMPTNPTEIEHTSGNTECAEDNVGVRGARCVEAALNAFESAQEGSDHEKDFRC